MKCITYLLLLFIGLSGQAQTQSWKGYFSYAEISSISTSSTEVYAATSSSVLVFDVASKQVETISSIEGLKTQKITTIFYSEKFKKLVVGNEDGSIQIWHRPSGKVSIINDIVNKTAIPPTAKRINMFLEIGGELFIATDYGISVLNLNNNAFGDTYFIGDSGDNVAVKQLAILGNWIYAATADYGLKRGLISNPNLVDFSQWEVFDNGKWDKIFVWSGQLAGVKDDHSLYRFDSGIATALFDFRRAVLDVQISTENQLMATTEAENYWFNAAGVVSSKIDANYEWTGGFSSAAILGNDFYVGTNTAGLFQYDRSLMQQPNSLSPDGPINNKVFSLLKTDNGLWMIFGGYSKDYNPHNPDLARYGLSFYSPNKGWDMIPYTQLQGAEALSFAAVNPRKPGHLYVSSFHSGFLDITLKPQDLKTSEVKLYNHLNTGSNGLQKVEVALPAGYVSVRINGTAFDNEGNAWMTNSLVDSSIKEMLVNGDWTSYSLQGTVPEVEETSFGVPLIDKNGTKWMGSSNRGLIGFNEKRGNKKMVINESNGNLPDTYVRSIALDNNNQLWIGTYKGLRIIPNVDRFINESQLTANSIIIKEDGIAQELFYGQNITKIKVDGANNKWVAVADAGVYLISPNGQKTLYRFTKANSPLPSNNISDIEIDGTTGEVFFATDNGMVSFKGSATAARASFSNVFAYPNPVRPEFAGDVKISGLMDKSNVKITDIEGNLVFEATSEGGTVLWDTYAFGGKKVSSGVYLILVSSKDGSEKTVKKIMVIR
ncbi:two-component regulator propeller domain-containing protein [Flavobacterium sp. NKUCC04_CG]|uniref:type IX secretion system anionic LPS delivery protein PorZ n=1 Tax=Flavobacterium sp. NKUCC04_CG TaxID=2842121 RepID=UPI001C5B652D|nr:T9SS type A sorting domain-containing protein [Flavobacterium sp. NKUCC04_CG]MBW3520174.1 T9SS type A sorting domain-containing protein [Flavobacterium sp. NKUCC04_CG]